MAILIISEDQTVLSWLEAKLRNTYTIAVASTAEAGLELLEKHSYDLIITDESYRQFCHHNTLVLVEDDDTLVKAFESGCNDCLRKPVELVELMARVGRALRMKNEQAEIRDLIGDLKEKSVRDPLTHLGNRLALREEGIREIAKANRTGSPLSLLMIDLDRFKEINDTHGHSTGDHVLAAVADQLRSRLRKYDLITRHGGDEFVVLLPNTDHTSAHQVAVKIVKEIAHIPLTTNKGTFSITVSIGISTLKSYLDDESSLQALLEEADQALYKAKAEGGNCVELYPYQLKV